MLPEPLSFSLPLGIAIALAALLSHVFVRIVIRRAADWGLQDLPNERSSHRTPTPRWRSFRVKLTNSGRGSFTMHFERYEAVPFIVTEQILERRRAANKIR